MAENDAYVRPNPLCPCSCSVGSFLNRWAATLPCYAEGELPARTSSVGSIRSAGILPTSPMVMGETLVNDRTLDVAAAMEEVLRTPSS